MKILIVEDSTSDRELLLELLQQYFMTEAKFREANSLSTAFDYLKRGDFDCVLLDLNLPDSTGWNTFHSLHDTFPSTPIVVVTHNKNPQLAVQLIREGAG
jgi:CheY-like chemotaxis protein